MKKKKEIVIKNLKYKVKVIQVSKQLLSLDFSFTVCSASSKKISLCNNTFRGKGGELKC